MAREEKIARLTRSTLRRIVMTAGDGFYATFEAGTPDISTLDSIPVSWARAAEAEIIPELIDLYRSGALATLIAAGGETLLASGISSAGPTALDDWQTIVNYDALDYQATATNRLVGVGDSVWNDVRSKTVTGLESGWTNERMKTEIESLGPFSEYRADTIARTEANAAYNGGNYDAADALGEYGPVAKTWSAFIDRRTRASHAAANDQTVAFSEPFSVGGSSMDRPHDPLAPAEEVVNCRCRVLFLYDGDTDPSGRVWTSDRVRASPIEVDVLDKPFEPTRVSPRQTAPSPDSTVQTAPVQTAPVQTTAVAPPRGAIPPDGFETFDEARLYLETHHPHIKWADDMGDWDRRMVRDVARFADEMADSYPDEWAKMRYVGSQSEAFTISLPDGTSLERFRYDWSNDPSTFGHAYTQTAQRSGVGIIGVNPKYAIDYDLFVSSTRRVCQTSFAFYCSPQELLVHEFGHIFDGLYRYDLINNPTTGFARLWTGSGGMSSEIIVHLVEVQQSLMASLGSTYGGSNLAEAFAESFLAMHKGMTTQQSMAARAFIRLRQIERVLEPGVFLKPFESVSALEEIIAFYDSFGVPIPDGVAYALRIATDV